MKVHSLGFFGELQEELFLQFLKYQCDSFSTNVLHVYVKKLPVYCIMKKKSVNTAVYIIISFFPLQSELLAEVEMCC